MGENAEVAYLIVGGGSASAHAAVGIRELDQKGSVLIVRQEKWWPYDRPPLSKGVLKGTMTPEDAESKDPSWFEQNDVEVRRGVKAISVDRGSRTVALSDGSTVRYGKLLMATGSSPRPLVVPGADLPGVHLFRTADDSLAVKAAAESGKRGVFIGTGYIGLEVASSCMRHGVAPVFIDRADHPWPNHVGPEAGGLLRKAFEAAGAEFHMGRQIERIEAQGTQKTVVLKGGEVVAGDFVVIGLGVTLNVDLAKAAGLKATETEGIEADSTLRTEDPNIYVAGDVACFDDPAIGRRWHAEHHLNAKWQGKQVGLNMAGAKEPYDRVPFFFSDFLDLHFALRGDPHGGRRAAILGDVDAGEFVELYARPDGTLCMGMGFSRDEPKLDKISDELEAMVRERPAARDITAARVGL